MESKTELQTITSNARHEIEVTCLVILPQEGAADVTYLSTEMLSPGADLTSKDDRIVALAKALWTQEVIDQTNRVERELQAVTIDADHVVQVAYNTVIYQAGIEVAHVPEVVTVAPGEDVAAIKDEALQAVAVAIHTPEVIKKYQADVAQREAEIAAAIEAARIETLGKP